MSWRMPSRPSTCPARICRCTCCRKGKRPGKALVIYNTLTRRKEAFETLEPGRVRMYVCGVTVYDRAHVGHAMSAVVFDIIRRYLEYRGYQVHHVVNYTDVEDKVIRRAAERGLEPLALAQGYIEEF